MLISLKLLLQYRLRIIVQMSNDANYTLCIKMLPLFFAL